MLHIHRYLSQAVHRMLIGRFIKKKVTLCFSLCKSFNVQWGFHDPIRPASPISDRCRCTLCTPPPPHCFLLSYTENSDCLFSSLRRLITLSAQWWSCLDLFLILPQFRLFLESQVIMYCILDLSQNFYSSSFYINYLHYKNTQDKIQQTLCTPISHQQQTHRWQVSEPSLSEVLFTKS